MDSSAWPSDPDHPAGSSPWQSSPQITRDATFNSSEGGSEPSSPLAKHSAASQRDSADGEPGTQDSVRNSIEGFAGAQKQESQQGTRQDGQQQDVPDGHERGAQQQQQPRNLQQRPNQPSRYHGTAQQRQRQNLPQYRLSAKITGLERTGRKDPVLKFDVHVCLACSSPRVALTYA